MTAPALAGIDACVFDAYGTLLDFNSAAAEALDAASAARVSELWRAKQLQYTWLRSLMGAYAPFEQVTGEALDHTLQTVGVDDAQLRSRLMRLYRRLAPFSDVAATLQQLRAQGLRLSILTNGSHEMIDEACRHAGITPWLDAILSVDEVGVFKPDPRVYALAAERLDLAPQRIAFVSANGWDAAGAAHFGLRVIWCNRTGQCPERLPGVPHAVIRSLSELPALLPGGAGQRR